MLQEKISRIIHHNINLNDCKDCFAVPGSDSMIDVIHPDTGLTLIYGKTLAEVRAEKGYEKAEQMTVDDFCKAKASRQDTPITWTETTEEKFFEMLEVLPPAMMIGSNFLVGEPWDHHATTGNPRFQGFREQNDKFYAGNRPMTRFEFKAQLATPIKTEAA